MYFSFGETQGVSSINYHQYSLVDPLLLAEPGGFAKKLAHRMGKVMSPKDVLLIMNTAKATIQAESKRNCSHKV